MFFSFWLLLTGLVLGAGRSRFRHSITDVQNVIDRVLNYSSVVPECTYRDSDTCCDLMLGRATMAALRERFHLYSDYYSLRIESDVHHVINARFTVNARESIDLNVPVDDQFKYGTSLWGELLSFTCIINIDVQDDEGGAVGVGDQHSNIQLENERGIMMPDFGFLLSRQSQVPLVMACPEPFSQVEIYRTRRYDDPGMQGRIVGVCGRDGTKTNKIVVDKLGVSNFKTGMIRTPEQYVNRLTLSLQLSA